MASELSQFIEKELRNKGYAYEDDNAEADNPHQTLIGALRVEVMVAGGTAVAPFSSSEAAAASWSQPGVGSAAVPLPCSHSPGSRSRRRKKGSLTSSELSVLEAV